MAGGERRRAAAAATCASRSSRPSRRSSRPSAQYDLDKAAELKYGKLPELEKTAQGRGASAGRQAGHGNRLIKEEVDEEDIAEVVSRWTTSRSTKLLEGEVQKLLHLDEELHQRVIGQDEAVHGGGRGGDPRPLRA